MDDPTDHGRQTLPGDRDSTAESDSRPIGLDENASPPVPSGSQFSPAVTGLAAVVLIASLALFTWLQFAIPRLDRVTSQEQALALMVSRSMDLEEAYAAAPVWERLLFDLTMSDEGDTLTQAMAWYEELVAYSADPMAQAQLAMLEAEAGRLAALREKVARWTRGEDPFPVYGRLLQAAYFEPKLDPGEVRRLQAELDERAPPGWFYDKLAIGLATRSGDHTLLTSIQAGQKARIEPLFQRARLLASIQVVGTLAGILALALVMQRQKARRTVRVGAAAIPPLWKGRDGLVVLIRGGAIGALMTFGLLSFEDDLVLRSFIIPLVNLPVLLLAQRHLFLPAGSGFLQALGLKLLPASLGPLVAMTAAVLAAGLLGEWVLGRVAGWLDLTSHWTEWFDGDLVWGSPAVVAVSLAEYVILAPMFEELIFRGLLFATFRRRYSWLTSALLSAAIFAVAHGYGLLGTASVLWSGVLWAWVYERSGSLLPGMIAHALNNFLVCMTIIWLMR